MKKYTVVIAIFIQNGKILVEKRDLEQFTKPQYLIPGGIVEKGEKVEDALVRETFEELGIEILSYYPLPYKEKIFGLKGQHLIPFIIKEWKGNFPTQILDKGTPVYWVEFDEALQSKVIPTKRIIEELKNHLL